ncbi:hypothetical protein DE146DRAFT_343211 [Phaeosphaeria sp. MPI-PUGE-AT-0046c]|nr:hypothetical protein DE146DRAFT_343211 [Phaeosphaeria sp. MPI-PUGE-AT-0046c]
MDEDDDLDIAAAMGFSSFGGTKKRKHDQTDSPQGKVGASGANTTELGVRTIRATGDEVDVGEANDTAASVSAPSSSVHRSKKKLQPPAAGLADFLARAQTLPERPPGGSNLKSEHENGQKEATTEMRSFGGTLVSKAELSALYHGVTNENGDSVIFLPNFVEDPWSKMKDHR